MLGRVKAFAKQHLSLKKHDVVAEPEEITSDNDGDFAALPMEIVFKILSFCALDAMITFSAVNRHFRALFKDNEYIWKDFYEENCRNFSDFSVVIFNHNNLISRKN